MTYDYPEKVLEAARRPDGDWTWTFFRCMTQEEKDAVDRWTVEVQHPLAFQPGTREYRFRRLVKEAQASFRG